MVRKRRWRLKHLAEYCEQHTDQNRRANSEGGPCPFIKAAHKPSGNAGHHAALDNKEFRRFREVLTVKRKEEDDTGQNMTGPERQKRSQRPCMPASAFPKHIQRRNICSARGDALLDKARKVSPLCGRRAGALRQTIRLGY